MMIDQDKKRKDEFKSYEMQKEHELREKRKNMTEEERKKDEGEYKQHHNKKHETMHEPVRTILTTVLKLCLTK